MDTFQNLAPVFSLSRLPAYTDFTALFDSYRIKKVEATFIFDVNVASASASQTVFLPNLLCVNDFDDAVALTAATDYAQYGTFSVSRLDRIVKKTFEPRAALGTFGGSVFTNYAEVPKGTWIDAGSPATEYYGLKFAIDATMEGGGNLRDIGTMTVYYKHYFDCRNEH